MSASGSRRLTVSETGGTSVPSAFLRSDGSSRTPGRVWSSPNWPHTSSTKQAQRLTCVADQRDHPLAGPGPAGAFAVTDMKLAEPAQLPFDIGQIELAGLIDPQPDLRQRAGRPA